MKGFVYLLEIAVAAILIVMVLGMFYTVSIKLNWESSDLIAIGDSMFNSLKQSGKIIDVLNGDSTSIGNVTSVNIDYGLKITGSPKPKIEVGCTDSVNCYYIDNLLTDTYINGHWINFTVEEFNITSGIPDYYDAIVFVNYTGYSNPSVKSNITEYLKKGGVVVGINATISNTDNDFNTIFGLTSTSSATGNYNFTIYNPSIDTIPQYFLGFGFDAYTTWYIWEDGWLIDYGSNYVNITKLSNPSINKTFRTEGSVFDLTGPDGRNYFFKVRKIWFPTIARVDFQPTNKSFVFKDFGEANDVTGKFNVLSLPTGQAAMTTNNSAIWISDFPTSDEYRTLLKAAIVSRKNEWYAKQPYPTGSATEVSSLVSLCCDMPETPKLTFILWYKA